MGKRTKARECAFQMLYQWDMSREPIESVMEGFWRVRTSTDETRERAGALARGAHADLPALDALIAECSTNWRLERIAAVDLNVIRIGAYELKHELGTPAPVVIDEAIEIARRFGEADSPAFVNGILDAVMRRVRAEGERVRGA